jgi:hypothetical protein
MEKQQVKVKAAAGEAAARKAAAGRRELILHSGYIRAAVEALSQLMSTERELRQEWREVKNRFGPVARERKGQIFSTARVGSIFADPKKTRAFAASITGKIDGHLRELLEHFATVPWRYRIFEVSGAEDRCLIDIYEAGQKQTLFSPEAVREFHKGGRRLMGLIFDNGKCLQSWGSVIRLDGFFEEDIHYFAGEAAPEAYSTGGIAKAIETRPVSFYMLSPFVGLVPPRLNGDVARSCVSALRMVCYDESRLSECRCKTERMEEGDVVRLLLGSDPSLYPPVLYADRRSNAFILSAPTLESYKKGRLALKPVAPFPAKPQRSVSAAMEYAAGLILGTEPPWRELDRHFLLRDEALGIPGIAGSRGVKKRSLSGGRGASKSRTGTAGSGIEDGEATLQRLEKTVYTCLSEGRLPDAVTVARESGCDYETCALFLRGLEALISGEDVGPLDAGSGEMGPMERGAPERADSERSAPEREAAENESAA